MSEKPPTVSKDKKTKSREKKERTGRKHESIKVWECYEASEGGVKRRRKHCPRCGPGIILSEHKNRQYCGRCGYTQFTKGSETKDGQIPESVKEDAKEQPAEEPKEAETAEKPKEENKEESE